MTAPAPCIKEKDLVFPIKDWEKRMEALNYSEDQKRTIRLAREKSAEWFKFRDEVDWKL